MQLSCRQIRRNVATLIAIAVAAFLLFSAPSHAGLLAEVSKDHWSFQAVGRLAGAGLADPLPERDSALPVDRYELARRVGDVRSLVEAIRSLDFDEQSLPFDSVRGVKARVIAAELQLERVRDLVRELEARDEVKGSGGPLLEPLREALAMLEGRFEELAPRAAYVWSLDSQGSASLADGEVLREIGVAMETIALDAAERVQRFLAEAPRNDQVGAQAATNSVAEVIDLWIRWHAEPRAKISRHVDRTGEQSATGPGEGGEVTAHEGLERRTKDLVKGFEALVIEYASELAVISPGSDVYGWAVFPGNRLESAGQEAHGTSRLQISSPISTHDRGDGSNPGERTGVVGVLDRLAAQVTARAGSDRGEQGLEYGWTPVTGLGSRMDVSTFPGQVETTRIGAEYPVSVSGVEIKAGVGWETVPPGRARESEATLEASVPMFGRRGGIGASYTVVDLDRLRELTSGGRDRDDASTGGREGQVRSWSIGGTVPLADVASIKVGYEVRSETASQSRAHDELLGAGLEYYLGSQGKVRAVYQWGTVDEKRGSSTGVDIGYRIGENTSLSASYSMIQFDAEGDTYRDNLGAAKLEVRF